MRQFFLRDYIKNAVRIFFFGIIAGILMILICRKKLQTDITIFNEEWILLMQNTVIDSPALFWYILFERLKVIGFMFLLSTTFAGIIGIYSYVGLWGAGIGVLTGILVLRYGTNGCFMMIVALFPQAILFIPSFLFFFHMCYMVCAKLYFPHKDLGKYGGTTKVLLFKNLIYIILGLVVVIIGVVLESYVNPRILISFLKKF